MALVHLVHAYAFFLLAPPLVALYLVSFRTFSARAHLAVVGAVATTLAVNAYWLIPALEALPSVITIPDLQLGASTRSPSISTMQARQFPSAR